MCRDIIFLVLGIAVGAFFSWLITRYYYKRAKKDNDESTEVLKAHNDESTEVLKVHIDKATEHTIKEGDTLNAGTWDK